MARSPEFLAAIDAYDGGSSDQALKLMEKCAESGDPVACHMVALWYKRGEGAPASPARSALWMRRLEDLAAQGSAEAQWELSSQYRWGALFPKDIAQANFWLEHAAASGSGDAQHHLACYLETGQYGYPVNAAAAAQWFQRAFEQEHPETLYLFAVRQFKDGHPSDESIKLLAKAAEKGFVQAQHTLQRYMQ